MTTNRPILLLVCLLLAPSCSKSSNEKAAARRSALKASAGFILAHAGSFVMGSPESEPARYTNESQHEVTLTRDFELAATEVRQEQFQKLMGYNPAGFARCASCPVETVSWYEAAAYTNALSRQAGLPECYTCEGRGPSVRCEVAAAHAGAKIYDCPGYRLPTDAEWEYAYRAGTTTGYYNGNNDVSVRITCTKVDPVTDEIGWYCANSGKQPHPVAKKKPNAWGLYDMAGNVWEWCHDKYLAVLGSTRVTDPWGLASSPMQVVRGGAWDYYARGLTAATRAWYPPTYRGTRHGFRPARTMSGR
jgi:formylglycine-generating enzyme required for sulfatase activity